MLPLGLLTAAQGYPMLVELKNGETVNGVLATCDTWMNLILKEAVQTSTDGQTFRQFSEVYIRGNNIKYLRVQDEIVNQVKEEQHNQQRQGGGRGGHRGGHRGDYRGGRGGGDHRGGGPGRGGRGRGRGGRGQA